jgi:tRNA threonylcarbamoyladenosine biosynthesis protein TsaB
MPLIIHLETATDICSVGLSRGHELISLKETDEIRDHTRVIAVMIDEVMKHSGFTLEELDAVSLSEGPGSYTSLRVGMSAAKALCFGLDKPLITVNTLYALAAAAAERDRGYDYYCAMIDARRMEVYLSMYDSGLIEYVDNEAIILNEALFDPYLVSGKRVLICGSGSEKAIGLYDSKSVVRSQLLCSAKNLVKPALDKYKRSTFADIAYFSPNYIKSPNITQAKNKLL